MRKRAARFSSNLSALPPENCCCVAPRFRLYRRPSIGKSGLGAAALRLLLVGRRGGPMQANPLLHHILDDDALTRCLGDAEARVLVEWLVEQAELLGENSSSAD